MKAETGIAEALKLQTTSFGMLNAGRGNLEASKATISVLILNLLDFFTAEWNITQLEDCVEIIATDYHWFSQAEFKIFTLRCKKGVFGPDYGKLSPQRLLMWLEEFCGECLFERAGQQLQVVKESSPVVQDFDIAPLLRELRKQMLLQSQLAAEAQARHHDENIHRYQCELRERWRRLRLNRTDNNQQEAVVESS